MGYADDEFTATITMPTPGFERSTIPATGNGEYKEDIRGFTVYAVNTGPPRRGLRQEMEKGTVDIATAGPAIRNHPTFPEGANVNFVEVAGDGTLGSGRSSAASRVRPSAAGTRGGISGRPPPRQGRGGAGRDKAARWSSASGRPSPWKAPPRWSLRVYTVLIRLR